MNVPISPEQQRWLTAQIEKNGWIVTEYTHALLLDKKNLNTFMFDQNDISYVVTMLQKAIPEDISTREEISDVGILQEDLSINESIGIVLLQYLNQESHCLEIDTLMDTLVLPRFEELHDSVPHVNVMDLLFFKSNTLDRLDPTIWSRFEHRHPDYAQHISIVQHAVKNTIPSNLKAWTESDIFLYISCIKNPEDENLLEVYPRLLNHLNTMDSIETSMEYLLEHIHDNKALYESLVDYGILHAIDPEKMYAMLRHLSQAAASDFLIEKVNFFPESWKEHPYLKISTMQKLPVENCLTSYLKQESAPDIDEILIKLQLYSAKERDDVYSDLMHSSKYDFAWKIKPTILSEILVREFPEELRYLDAGLYNCEDHYQTIATTSRKGAQILFAGWISMQRALSLSDWMGLANHVFGTAFGVKDLQLEPMDITKHVLMHTNIADIHQVDRIATHAWNTIEATRALEIEYPTHWLETYTIEAPSEGFDVHL